MLGFHPANFGLPRPFRSRVRSMHATDRLTERHRPSFYNAPTYGAREITRSSAVAEIPRDALCATVSCTAVDLLAEYSASRHVDVGRGCHVTCVR